MKILKFIVYIFIILFTDFRTETLQDWTSKLSQFVITTATQFICNRIQENNVIVIIGPTGSGKSANAYHVAFRLKEESGYTVIPARQSIDITNYHIPDTKQVFVIDDFIGKYAVDEIDAGLWEKNWPLLNKILSKNINTKLILTIRTYVWQPERYKYLSLSDFTCDLLSDAIGLSLTERLSICKSYLNQADMEALKDDTILMYSFLPSLCSSYASSNNISVERFFTVPYQIIEDEIHNFKIKSQVTNENEDTYFRRLAYEVGGVCNTAVFENEQNKFPEFRLKFVKYMKKYVSRDYLTKTQENMPVLHVVSALGYHDYTAFFIQDNQMVNTKDSNGNLPLHFACMKGHTKIVKTLVENKSFIDIANKEGLKPFCYACENDTIQIAKYLLQHSAKWINVDEKYQKRNKGSVLHIASAKGFTDIVFLLLKNKADVNVQDGNGCTPLHLASNITVVKALLDFKANINAVDFFGRSPLYCACSENHERVLQLLIKHNASVNQKTITGFTPLHFACQSGSIRIVKMLLEKGAKINSSKPDTVPLHEACKVGNASIINILIASNASVNHTSKDGLTPLHEACSNGHIEAVNLLLHNKANVNAANVYGWTALFLSCSQGFREIVLLLLEYGANPNIIDEDKVSPLIVACKENHTDVVRLLLQLQSDVNHCDKDNCSSLAFACKIGNVDMVNLLLTHGADINLADKYMITPLHIACMNNHKNVVLTMIDNQANVNAQDNLRQTPLFKSSINGYSDIVDILLNHGASVDICDKFGTSPLAIAEKKDIKP
ncbi:unnamed protein product [Mytilus coruscus]|uniref:Novel STAND NTPase 3 domain-containing protein n=1 Tax=Mytilus coruscus TaxID=42192 RepID=A0A6J8BED8_MYTCO|nr:unnamed protein product [Mytilus coruscus]